jgi:hypothetical protein
MTEKQKDFPELEGKEITYILSNDEKIKGIVDGCNYDIGIAIRNLDRSSEYDTEYLLCMKGPMAPNRPPLFPEKNIYAALFYSVVESIKTGVLYANLRYLEKKFTDEEYETVHMDLDYKSCPFSQ